MKKIQLINIAERGNTLGIKSLFLFPGFPVLGNKGRIVRLGDDVLQREQIQSILQETTSPWQLQQFTEKKELDYSYDLDRAGRYRVCAFLRMGMEGLVLRPVPLKPPEFDSLGLPHILKSFAGMREGLVLVTGPSGSGKSTTIASLLDIINKTRSCHIVTIEDVLEFVFPPERSIVSQREIGRDTKSLSEALRRVLREDPDVVMVSDIRDKESMRGTLELAETGHLVFATLHTINAVQTLNRIIDFFPDFTKSQIRIQLSETLKGVVSQRLLPRVDGRGFACASEVVLMNEPMKNLIRTGKIHQIFGLVDGYQGEGMISMDTSLRDLCRKGIIDVSEVISHSSKKDSFIRQVIRETADHNDLLSGRSFIDLSKESIAYRPEVESTGLGSFDSSGVLIDSPKGLLFRDSGQSGSAFHFVTDYSVLKGKRDGFPLRTLFNITYKIVDVNTEKYSYHFQLRVVPQYKQDIKMPRKPIELFKDGDWHTITIPVPEESSGKTVKYYMFLFDKDIREIIFSDIYFA